MTMTRPIPAGELEERLGAAFRAARLAAGVTLDEMARRLDCSVNTVRWHEGGARMLRADNLIRAASIIGCDPAILLAGGGAGDPAMTGEAAE